MKLEFLPEAEEALFYLAQWVEERNTTGSGERFITKFIDKIDSFVLPGVVYAICPNVSLSALKLRCIAIDDWVIAFKQTKEKFVVHYVLYGPALR